jgi:hypothetical protein
MACKVKVSVCSEIRTEHVLRCKDHVEYLNVKPGGT